MRYKICRACGAIITDPRVICHDECGGGFVTWMEPQEQLAYENMKGALSIPPYLKFLVGAMAILALVVVLIAVIGALVQKISN